jgi:hypothetical protein
MVSLFVLFAVMLAVVMLRSDWPEIYEFASPGHDGVRAVSWLETPVHLADDVMITLRSGSMIDVLGRPAYSRMNNSQPSTSYLAPYVFFGIRQVAPGYAAVYIYAVFGALAVAGTLLLIWLSASNCWTGAIVVAALGATTTLAEFSLSGWDHLFQGALLVAATVIALRSSGSAAAIAAVAGLGALGTLYRPDGLLIAVGLLLAVCLKRANWRVNVLAMVILAGTVSVALMVNWFQFGYLTPTTARLKVGASPSLEYSLTYVYQNVFQQFSVLAVFLGLVVFHLTTLRRLGNPERWILGAAIATGVIALFNSDVFAHGRMFWMPTCILAVLAVARCKPIKTHDLVGMQTWVRGANMPPMWFTGSLALAAGLLTATVGPLRMNVIDRQDAPSSFTAPQYLLTEWIAGNLSPGDGPVGLYWLGMAYYLPEFDAADFLGKADEMVASSSKKWGPPGHNKWQTGATVKTWNPQVIIPALPPPRNRDFIEYLVYARGRFERQEGWGFVYDLVLNQEVARRYKYCYTAGGRGIDDVWGFYVRNDLAERHRAQLTCYEPQGPQPNRALSG